MPGLPSVERRKVLLPVVLLIALAVVVAGSMWVWHAIGSPESGGESAADLGARPLDDPGGLDEPDPPGSGEPTEPGVAATPASCPATAAAPDPARPRVSLRFDVSDDRTVVTGSEDVTFVPDLPTSELVFRLWPNAAVSSQAGASLQVSSVRVGGRVAPFGYEGSEAGVGVPGTSGTVLAVPLDVELSPGQRVSVSLDFTLRLPPAGKDRYGAGPSSAWWGSGHPMLAWIDGRGWQRDPPPRFPGEGAGSEAADTEILVVAPAADTVLTVGDVTEVPVPGDAAPGRRAWQTTNPVARDVSVAVGDIKMAEDQVLDVDVAPGVAAGSGLPVMVGVAADAFTTDSAVSTALSRVSTSARAAVERLTTHLGFFPYRSLSVVVLPGIGAAGIEYPGAILLGTAAWQQVIPHEVAHQWFYGMLGNNQSVDPWLDEAFATYLESMYNGSAALLLAVESVSDPVGWPVSRFDGLVDYSLAVYSRGGGALLAARGSVGGQAFDAATRCYARANAWSVVDPSDVEEAYRHLPEVLATLNQVGALSGGNQG